MTGEPYPPDITVQEAIDDRRVWPLYQTSISDDYSMMCAAAFSELPYAVCVKRMGHILVPGDEAHCYVLQRTPVNTEEELRAMIERITYYGHATQMDYKPMKRELEQHLHVLVAARREAAEEKARYEQERRKKQRVEAAKDAQAQWRIMAQRAEEASRQAVELNKVMAFTPATQQKRKRR